MSSVPISNGFLTLLSANSSSLISRGLGILLETLFFQIPVEARNNAFTNARLAENFSFPK